MKTKLSMCLLVLLGIGSVRGADVLHGIPGGNFSAMSGFGVVNDRFGMPAGYWQGFIQQNSSVSLVGTEGDAARHVELKTAWSHSCNAHLIYVDYMQTPLDTPWKVWANLKLGGSGAASASPAMVLCAGEGLGSSTVFRLAFSGTTISWQAGVLSGTFTSETGLDSTYRRAVIQYNPVSGEARGMLGDEIVFEETIAPNLTVKTVGFTTVCSDWQSTTYSIENVGGWFVPDTDVLHGIPEGDFTTLSSLAAVSYNPISLNPGGWWGCHADTWVAGTSASIVGEMDTHGRHCELKTTWMNAQASMWYIDYFKTPVDQPWKIQADMRWSGAVDNENTSLLFRLLPDQDPESAPVFALRFYGYKVDVTTPDGTSTFISATGLDGTYRQVTFQYNPINGDIQATLDNEILFGGTTATGLQIQAVRFMAIMGSYYNAGTLSIDNLTAMHLALTPGDANGDGLVNVGDLGILAANYGGSDKTWAQGDFNGDGVVNVGDLGILAANYGSSGSSFAADYAKVFGATAVEDKNTDDADNVDNVDALCSEMGLPLIVGLLLAGLMLIRWDE